MFLLRPSEDARNLVSGRKKVELSPIKGASRLRFRLARSHKAGTDSGDRSRLGFNPWSWLNLDVEA